MNYLLAFSIAVCGLIVGYCFGHKASYDRGFWNGHDDGHDCEVSEREAEALYLDQHKHEGDV